MAFSDSDIKTRACDGTAKYTFKVSGSTEQVEMTAINEPELYLNDYSAEVPEGYFNPGSNTTRFGLDFIASKLYEDIFGKTFYTGGGSVGLLTDINEQSFLRNVKLNADYRPAGYFGEEI